MFAKTSIVSALTGIKSIVGGLILPLFAACCLLLLVPGCGRLGNGILDEGQFTPAIQQGQAGVPIDGTETAEPDDRSASLSSTAISFRFPIGTGTQGISAWYSSQINLDDGWRDANPFQDNTTGSYHLGHDFNYGSGMDDYGKPVYAVAAGEVTRIDNTSSSNSWGKCVLIKHTLPSGLIVSSFYAHLKTIPSDIYVGRIIYSGAKVKVGEVGNANGYYGTSSHLHFEMRYGDSSADYGSSWKGSGYSTISQRGDIGPQKQFDAIHFILSNWNSTYESCLWYDNMDYEYYFNDVGYERKWQTPHGNTVGTPIDAKWSVNTNYGSPHLPCKASGSGTSTPYGNGENDTATTWCIYVPNQNYASGAYLEVAFYRWINTEAGWDKLYLDISYNNGTSWQNDVWHDSGNFGWSAIKVNTGLSLNSAKGQKVRLRWRFVSGSVGYGLGGYSIDTARLKIRK